MTKTAITKRKIQGVRSYENKNAGSVHFNPAHEGTEIKVNLAYNPPAGAVGENFAKILGKDPALQLEEDLNRFKQMLIYTYKFNWRNLCYSISASFR